MTAHSIELDDLVLQLKGLVLVRNFREGRGAAAEELALYSAEIERVREHLARLVQTKSNLAVA